MQRLSLASRVEHVGLPEGQLFGLHAGGILVEKVSEVGCRAAIRGKREKHRLQV